MKKRNPLLVFIFSIITSYIYTFYWLHSTGKELNQKNTKKVFSIWFLVGAYIVTYVAEIIFRAMNASANGMSSNKGVLSLVELLVYLVVFIAYIVWYVRYTKSANEYLSGKLHTFWISILLIFLLPIGVAVIQNHYNKALESSGSPVNANQGNPPQQPMPNPYQPVAPPQSPANNVVPNSNNDPATMNSYQAPVAPPQQPMPNPYQPVAPPQQPMPNPQNLSNPGNNSDQAMDNSQQPMSSPDNNDQTPA